MAGKFEDLLVKGYGTKDLADLWGMIRRKTRTSPMRFDPRGLVEVPFYISMQGFQQDLYKKWPNHAPYVDDLRISQDIKWVLGFLEGKRVWLHHLSCAAECKSAHNTALAIHVISDEEGRNGRRKYYLAVPGINYVPSGEDVESWRTSGRLEDGEYERWREMIKRFENRV